MHSITLAMDNLKCHASLTAAIVQQVSDGTSCLHLEKDSLALAAPVDVVQDAMKGCDGQQDVTNPPAPHQKALLS